MIHMVVTGFVHGVGFRKFVKQNARQLSLTGWVRNNSDGSVEAVAVGPKGKLEELVKRCGKGPFLSQVDNLHVEWEENEGQAFDEFIVRHD